MDPLVARRASIPWRRSGRISRVGLSLDRPRRRTHRCAPSSMRCASMKRVVALLLCLLPIVASAQERDVVVTGGWLFSATGNDRVRNPGILIRAGKFLRVGGDLSIAAQNAERVQLADTETVIPGLFDLHAHYAVELFGAGRKDETVAYPSLFLANGVTSTFPAGEMDPNAMHDLRVRIENGQQPGPRLLNSGPYFGSAR